VNPSASLTRSRSATTTLDTGQGIEKEDKQRA
jgi:hypothetical protein